MNDYERKAITASVEPVLMAIGLGAMKAALALPPRVEGKDEPEPQPEE